MKAIWNGEVVAESEQTMVVEGNHYFPPGSVRAELLAPSDTTTHCPWKGDASYYTLRIGQHTNVDAAWYYPQPMAAAEQIRDHVAFWRGVTVEP